MKSSKCTPKVFKITRYFHIFSIFVIIAGTAFNMYASFNHKYSGLWLPVALAVMILFRLPNQVCVAHEHSDGWLSVTGSVIGMLGYIATVIIIVYTYHSTDPGDVSGDDDGEKDSSALFGI